MKFCDLVIPAGTVFGDFETAPGTKMVLTDDQGRKATWTYLTYLMYVRMIDA